ncbi:glucosamine-6-phosphate deaminase [Aestuariimicrobium ganziense]|uniref:glucosamine-6-phosphate deaminase n=1 Tax=Aestuariimicrobium ganziense TaxID=2773677 RepID=UPI001945A2C0|nr:glucosamine-6-phosphate deaminase [Aestuariimicrobium ganziense]
MEVIICSSGEDVARIAAERIVDAIAGRDEPVLGVATGSSPLTIYADLARRIDAGELDLSRAHAFALDEYVGLPADHPQSYAATIKATVTEPLRMDPSRVHVPDGMADDLIAACEDYEQAIVAAGGIDAQILGIGANGHIGFNEPTSSFTSRTRMKTLAETTRVANQRFFTNGVPVPVHCVTQGLGTIMEARTIVLVAMGEGKAEAVAQAVEGPVSAMWPASVLQFHRRASVIVDEAAAGRLALADYYRDTWDRLPAHHRADG